VARSAGLPGLRREYTKRGLLLGRLVIKPISVRARERDIGIEGAHPLRAVTKPAMPSSMVGPSNATKVDRELTTGRRTAAGLPDALHNSFHFLHCRQRLIGTAPAPEDCGAFMFSLLNLFILANHIGNH